MDLGSDLDETYNSIKCTGMVWASSKADQEFFLGWARPKVSKLQARKRPSLTRALGYYKIIKKEKYAKRKN